LQIASLTIQAVGLFGVVISILFVVRQFRQIERSIRGSSYQSIIYDAKINQIFVEEPDLADMWDGIEYLTPDNQQDRNRKKAVRQRWLVAMCLDHYENIYFQHELGNIPPELWARWERHLVNVLGRQSVFRVTWPSFRSVYSEKFVEFVDNIMSTTGSRLNDSGSVIDAIAEVQQSIRRGTQSSQTAAIHQQDGPGSTNGHGKHPRSQMNIKL
jgi:hypothetical protein